MYSVYGHFFRAEKILQLEIRFFPTTQNYLIFKVYPHQYTNP